MSLLSLLPRLRLARPSRAATADPRIRPDLASEQPGQDQMGGDILVALTGDTLDAEVMALACTLARTRHAALRVVYSIVAPRSRAIDDAMPVERAQAESALAQANEVANRYGVAAETECVQSREIGPTLVRIAEAGGCGVLLIGLPYHADVAGEAELSEPVDEALKRAPCRVWVVRGQALAA